MASWVRMRGSWYLVDGGRIVQQFADADSVGARAVIDRTRVNPMIGATVYEPMRGLGSQPGYEFDERRYTRYVPPPPMVEETDRDRRIAAVRVLVERGATEGERDAAREALKRMGVA